MTMAVAHQFALPDVGEGLTEAEIVSWMVEVGDVVAVNDLLVEVETAKSLVELPSPYAGTIARLHAAEGDMVEVGSVIVTFGGSEAGDAGTQDDQGGEEVPSTPGAAAGGEPDPSTASVTTDVDVTRQPVLVGYGPTKSKVERRARKPGYRPPLALGERYGDSGRPYATPPVRLRARELGIDLGVVSPSGSYGQVTHADLDTVERRPVAANTEPVSETRTPIKGVRKATAAAMVRSAFTAPHVTEWVTVDVTETLELLDHLRSERRFAGARLTPLVLIARAALLALAAHPGMNAKWDDDAGEIVRYRDVNLGIAAATPRGLIVPNVKAAQNLDTYELCTALDDLITEARSGKTQPEAMSKGTFTITNIGVFGVDGGTPILNPGEAGILCVGQIARRPWEDRGEVALRSVCTLSLSFDHRFVDGQLGSQVLSHIARLLAHPALALAS
jgi:2-oxoisovalerate dehydrogenase E2 component (dihydrolipoyl transacylase)